MKENEAEVMIVDCIHKMPFTSRGSLMAACILSIASPLCLRASVREK